MNYTDFRIKLQNFIRKNKNKILLIVIALTIIIAINIYLGKMQDAAPPTTSYEPHTPIIYGSKVTSKSTKTTIEDMIKKYMDYCNQKNYEEAYNSLTEDCKKYRFDDNIENFKKYIDYIFDGSKIYSIQDYSNKDNIYIYQVTISEDIMATGKNTDKSDEVYEEKVVITKDGDDYRFAVGGFIKKEDMDRYAENDDMKIKILQKLTYYDKIIYTLEIKNKTDYDIVLEKDKENDCIGISLNGEIREQVIDNYENTEKIIYSGRTKKIELTFSKYFDESIEPTAIQFNKIRILEKYTGIESKWEEELSHAVKQYSSTISL